MLITYADSMGGDLAALYRTLERNFHDVIKGVHILPCYPSSGDRGFAVIQYDTVDPAFGNWDDVKKISEQYYLMLDFMINHISIQSEEFRNYIEEGESSPYCSMFIDWDEFWKDDCFARHDMALLYKRKNKSPYKTFSRKDGKTVRLWNTFFDEQVDLDPFSEATQAYYQRNLNLLSQYAPIIRFDALAYTAKRRGTNCFFVEPEIWRVIDIAMQPLRENNVDMIAEIHGDYHIQCRVAERGYWVYDFALPLLVLHALMTGRTDRLIHWVQICPRHQFTTLDTHDGIGVVDVEGLLEPNEIELVTERVNRITADYQQYNRIVIAVADGKKEKLQPYQLMTTFFDALEQNMDQYLLARIVQLFVPGIPQIYYVGLLAGNNDIEDLKKTGDLRSVNRHVYTEAEIEARVKDPNLIRLYKIIAFRNRYPAFDGEITVGDEGKQGMLHIRWKNGAYEAALYADFKTYAYTITYLVDGAEKVF